VERAFRGDLISYFLFLGERSAAVGKARRPTFQTS
jgi:hypothetical protein